MTTQLTLNIFLYQIEPKIWRKISIPSYYTFAQLHTTIQTAMGWKNKNEHEFLHGKGKKLDQLIADKNHEHAGKPFFQDEANIDLQTFLGRKRLPVRLLYRYDLIEEWVHEIVIESKNEQEKPEAQLLEGARACPLENSGGAWEYNACLKGESDWMEENYNPEDFTLPKIKLLKNKNLC